MPERKRIAAIVTTWFRGSHADLIASKFATGFPTDDGLIQPEVELKSLYMDQVHWNDIGIEFAREHGIAIYPSIRGALTLTPPSQTGHWPTAEDWRDGELAVDGVLIIGEHGDYPLNERGQRLYPRRHFFEQVCAVFAASGRSAPVFIDKHLSYNWADARWMYDRSVDLNVPLMAGSSLPVAERTPPIEPQPCARIEDALSIGYHHSYPGGVESYGFHTLELLQAMVENRKGFETGIAAAQCLEGESVWRAAERGLWSRELAAAAESRIHARKPGRMEDNCENPKVFLIEYRDGFRAAALLLPGHIGGFGYAARVEGQIESAGLNRVADSHQSFNSLALNIQRMFLSGRPQYPVERTLLVSGALEALMMSRHEGHTLIETPRLNIEYRP